MTPLDKLWEKLGEGLAERWLISTYGPAFVFFAGGVLAYGSRYDTRCLLNMWNSLPVITQTALIVIVLFLVGFLANLVEGIQSWVIRLSEGYMPEFLDNLRIWLAKGWSRKIQNKQTRLQSLAHPQNRIEIIKKCRLDAEIAHLPVREDNAMPTLLGNLLRASEEYPEVRYGLNAVICWPRLYPLLPDTLRQSINMERAKLNESARLLAWSMLFLIWLVWKWWAIFSLPIAWIAYRGMISAAGVYGDLIRSAFDLYRFKLYESLCWDLPQKPDKEKENGKVLTIYLFRGFTPGDYIFKHKKDIP